MLTRSFVSNAYQRTLNSVLWGRDAKKGFQAKIFEQESSLLIQYINSVRVIFMKILSLCIFN